MHLCSTNLHWLPIKHCCVYKTVTLVYKLLKIGSCRYFAHFLHLQKACRLVDKVWTLVVPWWFQSFNHQFTSAVTSLATTLYLMPPPCGMLYLMTFEQLPLLSSSKEGSKCTSTTRHNGHSFFQYVPLSFVVGDPCYIPQHEHWIRQYFGNICTSEPN